MEESSNEDEWATVGWAKVSVRDVDSSAEKQIHRICSIGPAIFPNSTSDDRPSEAEIGVSDCSIFSFGLTLLAPAQQRGRASRGRWSAEGATAYPRASGSASQALLLSTACVPLSSAVNTRTCTLRPLRPSTIYTSSPSRTLLQRDRVYHTDQNIRHTYSLATITTIATMPSLTTFRELLRRIFRRKDRSPPKQSAPSPEPQDTNTATTPITQASRLLALPPELRNEIWRYVLTRPLVIRKQDGPSQLPPIAQTCRALHDETLLVFLRQTTFLFVVHRADGAFTGPAIARLAEVLFPLASRPDLGVDDLRIRLYLQGLPSWENVIAWAEWVHGHGMPGQGKPGGSLPKEDREMVFAVLKMARRLKGTSWETVKSALEQLPVRKDPRWA